MEDMDEDQQLCQQLINFGHTQWGFNHWSWTVTKQDLDFVDFSNGKYTAGVAGFVSVVVKSLDIQRENVGYATVTASAKGSAIYRARKSAVTNALRETLLSFGGTISTSIQQLLEKIKQKHTDTDIVNLKIGSNPRIQNGNVTNTNTITPNVLMRPQTAPIPSPQLLATAALMASAAPMAKAAPMASAAPMAKTAPIAVAAPMASAAPMATAAPIAVAAPMASAAPIPVNISRPPLPRPQPPRANPEMPPLPAHAPAPSLSTDEEARKAERLRRQKQAQEEFRLKLGTKPAGQDDQIDKVSSSFDILLMEIPTQEIMIEQSGSSLAGLVGTNAANINKRKSPDSRDAKRRSVMNRLDIFTD